VVNDHSARVADIERDRIGIDQISKAVSALVFIPVRSRRLFGFTPPSLGNGEEFINTSLLEAAPNSRNVRPCFRPVGTEARQTPGFLPGFARVGRVRGCPRPAVTCAESSACERPWQPYLLLKIRVRRFDSAPGHRSLTVQNEPMGSLRSAISAAVEVRFNAALRCGKRPNRSMIALCAKA
jgi:hypothetical protein